MLQSEQRYADFILANKNPFYQGLAMPADAAPPALVKDIDGKKGIVTVYFAAFGNIDAFREVIIPGAFAKTIREWGPTGKKRIKHLLHHNHMMAAGVVQELEEDNHGLLSVNKMLSTPRGRDTLIEYDEGHFTEHSIGFRIIKWEFDADEDVLILTEIQLFEGSAVTWGANQETPVIDIKSLREDSAIFEGMISKVHAIQRCLKREITDTRAVEMEAELASIKTLVEQWGLALRKEFGTKLDVKPSLDVSRDDTSNDSKPLLTAQAALQIAQELNLQLN